MTTITRDHPKFDEVLNIAIEQMSGHAEVSNLAAFKASIESVVWDGHELVLKFCDGVKINQTADDEEGETYLIKGAQA